MMIFGCKKKEEIIYWLDLFYKVLEDRKILLSETYSQKISASGGLAWTGDNEESIYELLSHADEALYEVKRESKGHYTEYQ